MPDREELLPDDAVFDDAVRAFRAQSTPLIRPAGTQAVRATAHRRRQLHTVAVAALVVATPLAVYGGIYADPLGLRAPEAPPSTSPTSTPTAQPRVPRPTLTPSLYPLPSESAIARPPSGGLPTSILYAGYPDPDGVYFYRVGKSDKYYGIMGFAQLDPTEVDLSADGKTAAGASLGPRSRGINLYSDLLGLYTVPGIEADPTCGALALSPNGRRIVFGASSEAAHTFEIADIEGRNRRVLETGAPGARIGCQARWSGDGTTIAYLNDGQLVAISANGANRHTVPVTGLPDGYLVHGLTSLSWNGRYAVIDGKVGPCACPDRRYWGVAHGDPYTVDLTTGRATKLVAPDGPIVGALFDSGDNLLVRVKTGDQYAIELLSLGGQMLHRRVEASQEGSARNEQGQVYESVTMVGYVP
jgi:hypothetical protein